MLSLGHSYNSENMQTLFDQKDTSCNICSMNHARTPSKQDRSLFENSKVTINIDSNAVCNISIDNNAHCAGRTHKKVKTDKNIHRTTKITKILAITRIPMLRHQCREFS